MPAKAPAITKLTSMQRRTLMPRKADDSDYPSAYKAVSEGGPGDTPENGHGQSNHSEGEVVIVAPFLKKGGGKSPWMPSSPLVKLYQEKTI